MIYFAKTIEEKGR